jgi:hypothetical protein
MFSKEWSQNTLEMKRAQIFFSDSEPDSLAAFTMDHTTPSVTILRRLVAFAAMLNNAIAHAYLGTTTTRHSETVLHIAQRVANGTNFVVMSSDRNNMMIMRLVNAPSFMAMPSGSSQRVNSWWTQHHTLQHSPHQTATTERPHLNSLDTLALDVFSASLGTGS